jgi:hypothetical protein
VHALGRQEVDLYTVAISVEVSDHIAQPHAASVRKLVMQASIGQTWLLAVGSVSGSGS